MGLGQIRPIRYRLCVVLHRRLDCPPAQEDIGQIGSRLGRRIQYQRSCEHIRRRLQFSGFGQRQSQIGEGDRMFGIGIDRLAVLIDLLL